MIWTDDKTGRFKKRPHYQSSELNFECERIINEFLSRRYSKIEFPITTEDLTVLIEENTRDFDSCKDLSYEGHDVEGITYFAKGEKPIVCISETLQASNFENRLRTTLTHELFHVMFHDFLYQMNEQPSLFSTTNDRGESADEFKCKRDNIIGAAASDWMEWQAGFGCGAFLIPISPLGRLVKEFKNKHELSFEKISVASLTGQELITEVSIAFQTSKDAARVRLLQNLVLVDFPNPSTTLTH